MRHRTPTLIRVNLNLGYESTHPSISTRKTYLAKIDGIYFSGQFSKEWYGWHFNDGWGMSGHQFDVPGYNSSSWEALWEISSKGKRK